MHTNDLFAICSLLYLHTFLPSPPLPSHTHTLHMTHAPCQAWKSHTCQGDSPLIEHIAARGLAHSGSERNQLFVLFQDSLTSSASKTSGTQREAKRAITEAHVMRRGVSTNWHMADVMSVKRANVTLSLATLSRTEQQQKTKLGHTQHLRATSAAWFVNMEFLCELANTVHVLLRERAFRKKFDSARFYEATRAARQRQNLAHVLSHSLSEWCLSLREDLWSKQKTLYGRAITKMSEQLWGPLKHRHQ